jgi:hypothetical protein
MMICASSCIQCCYQVFQGFLDLSAASAVPVPKNHASLDQKIKRSQERQLFLYKSGITQYIVNDLEVLLFPVSAALLALPRILLIVVSWLWLIYAFKRYLPSSKAPGGRTPGV